MSEIENKDLDANKASKENTEVVEIPVSAEKKDCCKTTKNANLPYIIIIILLVLIAILSFFAGKNYDWVAQKITQSIVSKDVIVQVIWDKKCSEDECHTELLTQKIKELPFLTWASFESLDYKDNWVKDLMKANDISTLPAVLVNKNEFGSSTDAQDFGKFLQPTKSWLFSLNVWSTYEPSKEVCDNKVDDNEDGLIDCKDTTCWKDLSCQAKVEKPVADLYIMSYCPYWLQAQKWYLEVMSKLSKVADVNIKWVPYTMHGKKEAQENLVQECIKTEQKDKYLTYLNCFLAEEWKGEACRKEAKIDEKKLSSCIDTTTKKYNIDLNSTDQTPAFNINKEEAEKAWVQWSPTFVLNGIKVESIWRSAKAYADAICSTFKNKPKECEQEFQNINFDPMFGFTTWNWAASANSWCGAQ